MSMDEWLKRNEFKTVAGRRVEQPAETAEYTGGSELRTAGSPRRCRVEWLKPTVAESNRH